MTRALLVLLPFVVLAAGLLRARLAPPWLDDGDGDRGEGDDDGAPEGPADAPARALPGWALASLDVALPFVLWGFCWVLVIETNALIPARTHPSFADNALYSSMGIGFLLALVPPFWRPRAAGIALLVLPALSLADIVYMRYFGTIVPIAASGNARMLVDVSDSIASLLEVTDLFLLPAALAGAALLAFGRVWPIGAPLQWRVGGWVFPTRGHLALSVLPAIVLAYALPQMKADVDKFLSSKWSKEVLNREDQLWNAGFVQAHLREAALEIQLARAHRPLTDAEREETRAWFEARARALDTRAWPSFGAAKGHNLIILQLEAIEAWTLFASIGGEPVAPFLRSLLEESLYYPNTFDQVGSSSTSDCEYLVLNSHHPLASGSVAFRREDNHFVTLGTVLKDAGYDTISMHAYRKGMWNRAVLHPRYGFDRSMFLHEFSRKPKVGWGLADRVFFDEAAEAMSALQEPFFAFLITLSSHHPYRYIPKRERRLKLGKLDRSMVGGYLHSVAYVDDALRELFADLDASGLLERSVIAMYGDHDAHLKLRRGDKKRIRELIEVDVAEGTFDPVGWIGRGTWMLDRIPLLIRLPEGARTGHAATAEVPAPGGQIDVAPTLLHYLGVPRPPAFVGRPRLPAPPPGVADDDALGMVARWDGSYVTPTRLFKAPKGGCRHPVSGKKLPVDRCLPSAPLATEQVSMSWRATNQDLAQWLQAGIELGPPPAPPAPPAPAPVDAGPASVDAGPGPVSGAEPAP